MSVEPTNSKEFEQSEISYLLDRYLAGRITEEQCAAILEYLDAHEQNIDQVRDQFYAHFLLQETFGSGSESSSPAMDWLALQAHSVAENSSVKISGRREQNKISIFNVTLALMLLIVFSVSVFQEFFVVKKGNDDRGFKPVAKIVAVVDVAWPENVEPPRTGQELEPGRIAFQSGLVELLLNNDVRLALEGPVEFQLHSASGLFCNRGRISATVSEKGKGFEIVTPLMTLVDLGTEFALDVKDEHVEAHTISGKVELSRISEGKSELVEGNAFRIDPQGRSERFEADPSVFLDKQEVAQRVADADQVLLDRWRERQNEWNADPSLLVHFDFEGKEILNRSERGRQETPSGRHVGLSRSRGRWTGKDGVEFRQRNDSVRLDVSKPLRSFTLIASVRIDALDRFSHCLLTSEDFGEGKLFWRLDGGAIRLTVQPPGGENALEYSSSKVLHRSDWGAWYQVASVFDAEKKEVRHYLDGRQVGAIPIEISQSIQIGRALLGNGVSKGQRPSDRSFRGCFDEFFLFERVLTGGEIQNVLIN